MTHPLCFPGLFYTPFLGRLVHIPFVVVVAVVVARYVALGLGCFKARREAPPLQQLGLRLQLLIDGSFLGLAGSRDR